MKQFFFILLFLLNISFTYAQQLPTFFKTNQNLEKWFIEASNDEKRNIIESLKDVEELKFYFSMPEKVRQEMLKRFHFLDFNNDGIKDFIYYGYTGGESEELILFRGTSIDYKLITKIFGKIFWTNNPEQQNPLQFKIFHYGCCGGIYDYIEHYTLKTTNNKLVLLNKELLLNIGAFPEATNSPVAFRTTTDQYTLRLTPAIDNENNYYPDDSSGNTITNYPKGSTGTKLAEQTDETGRVWWFVRMHNCNYKNMSANNNEAFQCYGWMSSRFLEIVE